MKMAIWHITTHFVVEGLKKEHGQCSTSKTDGAMQNPTKHCRALPSLAVR